MSHRLAAKITGVAGYVPPKVMTNADLEKIVETNDEWIRTRTGIRERHVAENGTATSQMATEAAKVLLAQTGTDPAEIDLIVLASVTPDMFFPDRKSTRLNSSHVSNSYAVFCLKKKMLGVDGIIVARELDIAPRPASEWEMVVSTNEGRVFHRRDAPFARVRSVTSIDLLPNEQFATATISNIKDSRNCVEADIFFFNDTRSTEIYTLSLHDALPI